MEYYRAYLLANDGKIVGFESFHSEDDGAALMRAKEYAEGCGVEIWNLGRFVGKLNAAEKTTWQRIFQKGESNVNLSRRVARSAIFSSP